jgi:predicted Ser/Thr protein kinase
MTVSSANEPSIAALPLSDRCPLPPADVATVFGQLLDRAIESHGRGLLLGRLTVDRVLIDNKLNVRILDSATAGSVATCNMAESLPPELGASLDWNLPLEVSVAETVFRQKGIACDPRRIDVCQLGAILCRMLTAEEVANYLKSPRTRGKVPAAFRPVIDGALGYDPQVRISDCGVLQERFAFAAAQAGAHDIAARNIAAEEVSSPAIDTPPHGSLVLSGQDTPVTIPPESGLKRVAADFDRLGPYKIIARIGSGGMGDVYQAYEKSLDRNVAIKVLPAELARHDAFVQRFHAEATAVAKLVHPNIVQIHAVGEDSGHHYFVMQFVKGESLAELLARRKRLPVDEALEIAEACLHALAIAHHHELIHRDVKPGNILIEQDTHRVLMVDFGLVKRIQSDGPLTATGAVLGTVDYIPPEQALGMPVDGRADLYSLGVVMYQMLSGRLPFVADSPTGMAFQHAYEQPEPLEKLAPGLPRRMSAIVTRLMAKNPDHRYQTAADVISDVVAYRAGKPPARPKRSAAGSNLSAATLPAALPAVDMFGCEDWSTLAQRPLGASWRERILNLFRRRAFDLGAKLQATQLQVDDAILPYLRRRDELRRLVRDNDDLIAEMSAQVASHREAAEMVAAKAKAATDPEAADKLLAEQVEYEQIAAGFDQQLAAHRVQKEELHAELSKVSATLASLESQRDILQARLESARARARVESPHRGRRFISLPVVGGAAVVALISAAWFAFAILRARNTVSGPQESLASLQQKPLGSPPEFPLGKWVEVLNLIDPARDSIRHDWARNDVGLVSDGKGFSRIEFPVTVEGDYDLAVDFTRPAGDSDAATMLSIGSHTFMLTLSGWEGVASGLMEVDTHGANEPENPTSVRPGVLANGVRHHLSISARMLPGDSGSVDVALDGKPYLPHWEGKLGELRMPNYWGVGYPRRIGIGSSKSLIIFHSAQLRMVSGHASFDPMQAAKLRGPSIISAKWGIGNNWAIVSQKVRHAIQRSVPVRASTDFLNSDPLPYRLKELWIRYETPDGKSDIGIYEGDEWTIKQYGRLAPIEHKSTPTNPPK